MYMKTKTLGFPPTEVVVVLKQNAASLPAYPPELHISVEKKEGQTSLC
jgi:hypothetical protein